MSNTNYTKVNDELVAKYGLKAAWIYAKLHYRMNLSNKHHKYYSESHHSHYVIYKVNDLAKDCHMGRNAVIRALKKLEQAGLIYKDRTMFCNHIYLPKFNCEFNESTKTDSEIHESKLPREQRYQNKYQESVYVRRVDVKKAKSRFPKINEMKKRFGVPLFRYAIHICRIANKNSHVVSPTHFIYGILRRWQRHGIKTVNKAMLSEKDSRAQPFNGPRIPIFKI